MIELEAQVGVLGSVLLDTRCAADVFLTTDAEMFDGPYRSIYDAMLKLHREDKPIDPITLRELLSKDYIPTVMQIAQLTPTAAHVRDYCRIVREEAAMRDMENAARLLTESKTIDEARAVIESASKILAKKETSKVVGADQGVMDFFQRQQEQLEPVPWGFPKVSDTVLTAAGDFIILGGRPSAGKTALSLQMAWEQSETMKVGYFSLETSTDEVYDRLVSMAAGIDSGRVRRRKLRGDEMQKALAIGDSFGKRKLEVIQAAAMTVDDIRAQTVAGGYQIVYVDYIQIVNPPKGQRADRFGAVTDISMDLHRMAVSLGVVVVGLSQLRRPEAGVSKKKPPSLSDLRESGQLEQDAEAVFLLHREDEDDNRSQRILRIAKNKKGMSGGFIHFDFDGPTQRFTEAEVRSNVVGHFINEGMKAKDAARRNPIAEGEHLPF